jgi:hypothetical protein
MILAAKRSIVFLVAVSFVSCGLPHRAPAQSALTKGAATADAAVSRTDSTLPSTPEATSVAEAAAKGQPVLAMGALNAYADPDTSEFEFPEDENKHLVRDITVWLVAAAFVAFFIIKVFIEEDEEAPPDDTPPGKQI